jgi:DNA invertase Pin-like site-specific DNA recombinase
MSAAEPRKCVAYYRVSTQMQGKSGLGLEAQQRAVRDHLERTQRTLIGEMTEIESGKKPDRPKLTEALRLCRAAGATLVVARLDRLARSLALVSRLMEAGTDFEAVDFPQANRFTIHILAAVAEYEGRLISERIREGLAAAKARGVKLGGPNQGIGAPASVLEKARQVQLANVRARMRDLAPVIAEIQAAGIVTPIAIARELNARGIRTVCGGPWSNKLIPKLLARLYFGRNAKQAAQAHRAAKHAWMAELAPVIADIRASGCTSARSIARALNARGISACKGGAWRGDVVQALMARLANGLSPLSYVRRTNHLSKLRLIIKEIQASGIHSANGIGRELNARGIRGLLGGRWGANQVRQVLMRLTEGLNRTEFMSTQAAAAVTWVSMLKPIVARIQARGHTSMKGIARELNARRIPAYCGGRWRGTEVRRLMARMEGERQRA